MSSYSIPGPESARGSSQTNACSSYVQRKSCFFVPPGCASRPIHQSSRHRENGYSQPSCTRSAPPTSRVQLPGSRLLPFARPADRPSPGALPTRASSAHNVRFAIALRTPPRSLQQAAHSPSADIEAGHPLRLFRPRQQWRLKLTFQRSSIRRSRGGSTGWLINGYSRAKLTITATAP
jgi:hypothetical protein